jgi:hypothetical protein
VNKGACNRTLQRAKRGRRVGPARLTRRCRARARRPKSPANGEQQMDPVESATILALPGVGSAVPAGEEIGDAGSESLPGAA